MEVSRSPSNLASIMAGLVPAIDLRRWQLMAFAGLN
jgi:hypothetical protein